jgi:hypothetical protein
MPDPAPLPSGPSVQFTSPPARLIPDLRKSINEAVATLAPSERGALVLVGTKQGDVVSFNAAVVARVGDGWAVQAFIGKRWGQPVEGGATVVKTW